MKKKFAVFDIDGTIARTALFFQIVDELLEREVLPIAFKSELDELFDNYRKRTHKDAFRDYSQKSVDILLENLTTVPVTEYRKAVDVVAPKTAKYVYVYTRDLIEELRKQDYFLIALSGSEMYSVQKFSEHFGFDLAVGERYHEKDGYFTGEIEQVVHRKDKFIRAFIEDHNLTLKGSYGVGDSMGDFGMLEMVEHPIAFNPEDRLFEKAKSMGWDIVVERKNVTYELRQADGHYILA
jgi:HAD superfamily hydrolase (TIGR01490 family)